MTETLHETQPVPREPAVTDEVVRLAQAGDEAAIVQVYLNIRPLVERIARRVYGNNLLRAEEVAADALARVIERGVYGQSYRDTGNSFDSWACTVAINRIHDDLRTEKRHPTISIDSDDHRPQTERLHANPSAETQALAGYSIVADPIRKAFGDAGVPDEFMKAFMLHHVDKMTQNEIAELLGIARGTVASRINRAKSKMLAHHGANLKKMFGDPTE
jgi:RNA polymerase sigma factor (sigma-70 family)